uniref:Lipocalin/cytosolic fatty-acid binding domain-containing protein n=1 Tax=Oryzias latipes TaxID=8090 RepID=A0A3B3IN48_ORYLA
TADVFTPSCDQTLVCFYTKFAIYILAMKAESTFKTTEIKFKLDEEFNETAVHGRNVKSTFTLENGKFVQKQNSDGKTSTLYIDTPDRTTGERCSRSYNKGDCKPAPMIYALINSAIIVTEGRKPSHN